MDKDSIDKEAARMVHPFRYFARAADEFFYNSLLKPEYSNRQEEVIQSMIDNILLLPFSERIRIRDDPFFISVPVMEAYGEPLKKMLEAESKQRYSNYSNSVETGDFGSAIKWALASVGVTQYLGTEELKKRTLF